MSDSITWVNSEDEMNHMIDEAAASKKRAVVVFTAPSWCGPCRQFEPHLARVADNTDDIVFIGVSLDNPDDNQWSADFGVKGVPTAWLFDEEGIFAREVKVPQGGPAFQADIRK